MQQKQPKPAAAATVVKNLDKQFAKAAASVETTPIRSPYLKKPRVTSPVVQDLVYPIWFALIHGFQLVNSIASNHAHYNKVRLF